MQFLNATLSPSTSSHLVSVDLEVGNQQDANELINKYNGQIADGNKLSVSIVKQQSLNDRMSSQPQTGRGQELITPSSGYAMSSLSVD
jgi:hypothetical protein